MGWELDLTEPVGLQQVKLREGSKEGNKAENMQKLWLERVGVPGEGILSWKSVCLSLGMDRLVPLRMPPSPKGQVETG